MVEGFFLVKNTKLLSKGKKMYFFNGKTIETMKIQITKIDQMIMFYNTMWLTIPHSCIWGLFGGWFPHLY